MEALIAALVGWISTEDQIINIQTGLRIQDITPDADDPTQIEIFFPDGTSETFDGTDADEILDRCDQLAVAGKVLLAQLTKMTGGIQPEGVQPQ